MESVVECLNIPKQSPLQRSYKTLQFLVTWLDRFRYSATFAIRELKEFVDPQHATKKYILLDNL